MQKKTKIILGLASVLFLAYVGLFVAEYNLRQGQIERGIHPDNALPVLGSDSLEYATLARNLVDHEIFSIDTVEPRKPDTFRTIGYPALVAMFLGLGLPITAFPLIQIVIVFLTAFGVYLIGKSFFSEMVGVVAGFLFLLDPVTIVNSLVIVTDTLYVGLLVWSIYFFFCSEKSMEKNAALAGLLLGLSTLVRPISMFLLPLLLLVYIIKRRKNSLKFVVGCVLFYVLSITPWIIRNYEVTRTIGISTVKSYNLYHYYVPEFLATKQNVSADKAREIVGEGMGQFDERSLANASRMQKRAFEFIKKDPVDYALFHLLKTIPFFLSSGYETFSYGYNDSVGREVLPVIKENMTSLLLKGDSKGIEKALMQSPLIVVEQVLLASLWVAAFFALYLAYLRRTVPKTALLWLIILYFALLTGPVAYSRYRLPATPFLFILVSYAIVIRPKYETPHNHPETR